MNNSSAGEKPGHQARNKMPEATKGQLKDMPVAELLKHLQTSPDGLSKAEAEQRLGKYG